MPLYDFECPTCGTYAEIFRKTMDITPPECCGQPTVMVFTPVALIAMGKRTPFYDKLLRGDPVLLEEERKRLNSRADTNTDYEEKYQKQIRRN